MAKKTNNKDWATEDWAKEIWEEHAQTKKVEKEAVKKLGEKIGYGNLMNLASECWRESLEARGLPPDGAFSVGLPYGLLEASENNDEEKERMKKDD